MRLYNLLQMPKERNTVARSFAFVQRERAVARREEETWGCDYGEGKRALEMELARVQSKEGLYRSQIMAAA